jgi:hypothetical protein
VQALAPRPRYPRHRVNIVYTPTVTLPLHGLPDRDLLFAARADVGAAGLDVSAGLSKVELVPVVV